MLIKIRAISLGSTLTSQYIWSDSTKNASNPVAQDFSRVFPTHQVHVIQRENPAAAAAAAAIVAPANLVLGCPKVLRHQRRFSFVVLGLLLGTQDGSHSCFLECNHQRSCFGTQDIPCFHFIFGPATTS